MASGLALVRDGRPVLVDVALRVAPGESLAVVGASGAGKTTLLDVLCGLLLPDSGTVRVGDVVEVTGLTIKPRSRWRLRSCGVVFQFAELLPELTLQENVELPLRLLGVREDVGSRARAVLDELEIAHLADRLPGEVSGGERQRAGIARAVVHDPALIVADEPTGSLDPGLAQVAAALLYGVAARRGACLVVATHNPQVASQADIVTELSGGTLRTMVPR